MIDDGAMSSPRTPSSTRRVQSLRKLFSGSQDKSTKYRKQNVSSAKTQSDPGHQGKSFSGSNGRGELLNLLREKDDQILLKERQLHEMNDKFHEINRGLTIIEEERWTLKETTSRLEREKKDLQKSLDVREKEVLNLVRRCSSQEERLKGSGGLRATTKDLQNEVEDLKSKLNERDLALVEMVRLQKDLSHCQAVRTELEDQLETLKRDHESVTETLHSTFEKVQKLTSGIKDKEDERRREQQRALLELEKQRLDHLQVVNGLREELHEGEDRLSDMERTIRRHIQNSDLVREEMEELKRDQEAEMARANDKYEKDRSIMTRNHLKKLENIQHAKDSTIKNLESELEAKELVVVTLEDEISKCMHKMMSLSSDLQNINENRNESCSQLSSAIEKLEEERNTLRKQLSTREADAIELTASICRFESENILLKQENVTLQEKLNLLEAGKGQIVDLQEQILQLQNSVTKEQQQKALLATESQRAVSALQQQLEDHNKMRILMEEMEEGLQDKISQLEEEKVELNEDCERQLNEYRSMISAVEDTLEQKDRDYRKAANRALEVSERVEHDSAKHEEVAQELRKKIQTLTFQLAVKEDEIRELKLAELPELEEKNANLRIELTSVKQQLDDNERKSSEVISNMESQLLEVQAKSSDVERVFSESRQDRGRHIQRLTQQITDLQKSKGSLEEELSSYVSKLQERHSIVASLTRKNTLLERREVNYRSEIDQMKAAQEKAASENETLLLAIQREQERAQIEREDDHHKFSEKHAELERQLMETRKEAEELRLQQTDQEEVLEARSRLLADMVAYNKGNESELAKERIQREAAERELQEHVATAESSEKEVRRLSTLLKSKEEQYWEAIQAERDLREIAEADLQSATRNFSSSRRDSKEMSDLEKENKELRDKVRRQESYLKRKLRKEKVMRDRSNGPSKAVMTTPLKNATNRKRLNDSNGSTSRSISIPESSTFPDAWESDSIFST